MGWLGLTGIDDVEGVCGRETGQSVSADFRHQSGCLTQCRQILIRLRQLL